MHLATLALALTLGAEPGAWLELGRGVDGGAAVEARSIAGSDVLTTALEVKQVNGSVNGSSGTTHIAQQTVISCPRCGPPLLLATSGPLIDHVVDLGDRRFLLLGWSSGGGGWQAVHALLVHLGAGGPELIDRLAWGTTRAERGVLLEATPAGWRVGLPRPTSRAENGGGARLSLSEKTRPLAELDRAGFFRPLAAELGAFAYCPPSGESLRVHVDIGWVSVTAKGFRAGAD